MVTSTDSDGELALVASAVGELVRRTRFPVAFGGLEHGDAVHVTSIVGARTHSLDGLVVHAGRGLGGRALVEKRPRLALDYRSSRSITHDYDRAVLGEGISTLFAVPVMVGARARGVALLRLVGAVPRRRRRREARVRGRRRAVDRAAGARRGRAAARRHAARTSTATGMAPAAREELRESYAELRSIAAGRRGPALRDRLGRARATARRTVARRP